jgi:hypothetical protein
LDVKAMRETADSQVRRQKSSDRFATVCAVRHMLRIAGIAFSTNIRCGASLFGQTVDAD